MRFMKSLISVFSIGISFLMAVGMVSILDPSMAKGELVPGVGYIQGDPGDGLGSDGLEGDPTDGFGASLALHVGNSIGGLVVLGDPRDGLDCPNLFGDPGDGMDFPSLEFNGDPDDGLDRPFGDPEDGLDYLVFLHWVWIP